MSRVLPSLKFLGLANLYPALFGIWNRHHLSESRDLCPYRILLEIDNSKSNFPPQPRFGTPHICTSYKSFTNTAIYSHGATLIPRHFRFRFRCSCGATARFNSTITLFPSEDGANVDKVFYFLKEATRLKDKCTPTEIQRISHGRAAI